MPRPAVPVLAVVLVGLGGCAGPGTPTITSSDSTCTISTTTVASGQRTFSVDNRGSRATDVVVLASGRELGAVTAVAPGGAATLTARLPAGDAVALCRPGQTGVGIPAPFLVRG